MPLGWVPAGGRQRWRTIIDLALPILFVISAIVFGPLSAWLAVTRERSAAIWFAYGLLLGPIAPVLIALAPPGRCRVCGERSRGWLDRCLSCGSPLDGSARVAVTMATGAQAPASAGPTPTESTPAGAARSGANLAAVGAVPATAVHPGGSVAPTPAPHVSSRGSGETEILATGVFVGGSVHLSLGARYAIARRKRTFEVLGPVDIAPGALRLEHPMAGLDATVVADRLVVTEKTTGRPKFVMVFQSLAVQAGVDLESAFGTKRRTRARPSAS
jgi:hypothetical protein